MLNIILWILQVLLALHTLIGSLWKFSHPVEQTMPTLKAIPQGAWLAMSVFEILLALALIVPAFYKPVAMLVPVAALCIATEMLLFSGVHLASGNTNYSPIVYWLIVAAVCGFIAYGRFVLKPL